MFRRLETNDKGLSEEEAARRLEQHGPNVVAKEQRFRRLKLLGQACANPLVILLLLLAAVTSWWTRSRSRRAERDAGHGRPGGGPAIHPGTAGRRRRRKLKAMIRVTATVVRDGQPRELPLGHLVPGDVVQLAAGDMIPADLRLVSCKDLFVIQSSLTGESLPVEKFDAKEDGGCQAAAGAQEHLLSRHQRGKRRGHGRDRGNGIQDLSGQHGPVDRRTGAADELRQGREPLHLADDPLHAVMVPLVFLINGLTKAAIGRTPSSSRWPWPWASRPRCCR